MEQEVLFSFIGGDQRMSFAQQLLEESGYRIVPWNDPGCTHYILPLPAFHGDTIRSGPALAAFLSILHPGSVVLGGKLDAYLPELQSTGAKVTDYYLHEPLIAANARLTAEGAVTLAAEKLPIALNGAPVLVCGWGRIGQHLARILGSLGARVSVSARKPTDLAMIQSLGYHPITTGHWQQLSVYRAVFNTIPAPIFTSDDILLTRPDCCRVELASASGFSACPQRPVIMAPGLPGAYAPETAGRLIGKTILTLLDGEGS